LKRITLEAIIKLKVVIPILILTLFLKLSLANGNPQKLFKLPKELKENSGMVYHDSCFWLLNDGGNPPILYKLNYEGEIIKKVRIINAKNHDWEELKRDQKGNYYIGDFGNNSNARRNLAILKIKGLDTLKADSVRVKKIPFSYEDQLDFPPSDSLYFDCEAFEVFHDHILLFKKNRTKPYDQKLKIYKLTLETKPQIAQAWKTIELPGKKRYKSWITASCKSQTEIILLSSAYIYRIKTKDLSFSSSDKIGKFAQWEAISFNDKEAYVSNEQLFGTGRKVYRISF
jgi:hypothetical protein